VEDKRLIDPEGRHITHLRMSVTQECNLSCTYCHKEGEETPGEEMSCQTACRILSSFASFGVDRLKVTGGEPLLREDICLILDHAKKTGFTEVSLTTNGTLLPERAEDLKEAGLDRLNIGCDSVSSSVLPKTVDAVLPALEAARKAGFKNTKLNMVVLAGVNEHEIEHMMEFAAAQEATLQLIELIPTGNGYYDRYYYPLGEIEELLQERAESVTVRRLQGRRQYHLPQVDVEVVRPFHGHFCSKCAKMRVTSDGSLRPCLMRNDLAVPYAGDASILEAVSLRRIYAPDE
jgi:cyclic pyranopterin phosphate synthase